MMDYDDLDPGIRETVKLLRDAGLQTTDSGDGVSKTASARTMDVPHVMGVCLAECAQSVVNELGDLLPGWHVQATLAPYSSTAVWIVYKLTDEQIEEALS